MAWVLLSVWHLKNQAIHKKNAEGDKMKKMTKVMWTSLVVGLFAAPGALLAADAGPAPLAASIDLPVLSSYVWRGQDLTDRPVVQPSLTLTKGIGSGTLSLNYWQNFNLTDQATGNSMEFSEHDITLSYAFTCPITGAGMTLGIVNYDFPNQSVASGTNGNIALVKDTREVYWSAGYSDLWLQPAVSVYYDFKAENGFYYLASIGHSFEIQKDVASFALGFSTGLGSKDYNKFYFGSDKTALEDGNVTAALPYVINKSWTITPGAQYTWLWDSTIRDDAGGLYRSKDEFVGSIKATYTF